MKIMRFNIVNMMKKMNKFELDKVCDNKLIPLMLFRYINSIAVPRIVPEEIIIVIMPVTMCMILYSFI